MPSGAAQVAKLPSRMIDVAARRDAATSHSTSVGRRARPSARRRTPRSAAAAPGRRGRSGRGACAPVVSRCKTGSASRPPIAAGSRQADALAHLRSPASGDRSAARSASTSSIRRCSSTHTGRMLQLCDDEQRSSSTGCDVQCTSNVECSDAEMTSRTVISSAARAERVSAVRAARAAHDAGTTQLEHDLLDVVAGQTLAARRSRGPSPARRRRDGPGEGHR